MAVYKLSVTTGDMAFAGTWDHVYVTLIGTKGQTKRTELDNIGFDFSRGKARTYTVKNSHSLGTLLLLTVEKDPFFIFPEDMWYCSKIVVTTPEDKVILFPCYKWLSRGQQLELRGGKATLIFEDDDKLLVDQRKNEILRRKEEYQWKFYCDGLPHCYHTESNISTTGPVSESKSPDSFEQTLKGMLFKSDEKWASFETMKNMVSVKRTAMTDYVINNWKEDSFFGYQLLNGVNPNVIRRCSKLPSNFPVTNWMVKSFFTRGTTLEKEMEKGNIFICDYKKMEGIAARFVSDEQALFVASGFCLLYVNTDRELMPIAIQLAQKPSEDNPIFLPSDSESDWLLAKMFIKNADNIEHQGVQHLLRTHLLGEVFAMATYRNLPSAHPIYKLLIPHFRTTIQENNNIRNQLLGPAGTLSISSLGRDGVLELMKRSLYELKYSTLCLPEDITERGLDTIPNFYYRDDGLRLWRVLNSFVTEMIRHYYLSDEQVVADSELQDWVKDVFIHGVIGSFSSGFPECLQSAEELVKFVTIIIFTVSAQHAAVNNGQYDYYFWIPNGSLLLTEPPPNRKGKSSMETVLKTLPSVGDTAIFTQSAWSMSNKYNDMIPLGSYPDEQFDELVPKQILRDLENELLFLTETITERNKTLQVPYNYLNPAYVDNSITI